MLADESEMKTKTNKQKKKFCNFEKGTFAAAPVLPEEK